jgi:hypothetical protein
VCGTTQRDSRCCDDDGSSRSGQAVSPRAWQRLAKAIEGPSETLDRLCLWAWRGYHRAEQRQASTPWARRNAAATAPTDEKPVSAGR